MKRVLMVAYYFPPLGGIASLRAAEFAKHLPEFGWEPTVIAPLLGTFYEDRDSTFPEERVIRTRSIELSRLGKRALRVDASPPADGGDGGRARGLLRGAAHRFLYRPDPQIGWYPSAVWTGRRVIRDKEFDALFSTSVPMTAHKIGRRLHRASGLPWIAEFRDPWPEDRALQRLERSVAHEASGLVMTSPTWAEEHGRQWRRQVTPILAGTVTVTPSEPPPDPVITHLGSFYPRMQDLSAMWDAIQRLTGAGDLRSVRIRFIGEIPRPVRQQLEERALLERTEATGYISHEAALKLLAESSVLIGAGPRDARESLRGWIPAKLLEYLSTELPIVYVSHIPNDGAELIRKHPGCHVVAVDDRDGCAAAVLASIGKRFERDIDSLSWRSRARELAASLDQAMNEQR